MNDKCPKCGSELRQDGNLFKSYKCGRTLIVADSGAGCKGNWIESDKCRIRELELALEKSGSGPNIKCEGCGSRPPNDTFKLVRTLNGCLFLCPQCLGDVNRKNPRVRELEAENERLANSLAEWDRQVREQVYRNELEAENERLRKDHSAFVMRASDELAKERVEVERLWERLNREVGNRIASDKRYDALWQKYADLYQSLTGTMAAP